MKQTILTLYILTVAAFNTYSQTGFVVKGDITNIADGKKIFLSRYRDGSMDPSSIDTIKNGHFSLTDTVSAPTLYLVHNADGDKQIWASPGQTIELAGKSIQIGSWKIRNPSSLQQEADKYNTTERARLELMRTRPVTEPWLQTMFNFSFGEQLSPNGPYRKQLLQLYNRMSKQQQTSPIGEKITANLFPPPALHIGDPMASMPVIDTQLITHNLSDYKIKNKYLLLDFGFTYCGACELAMPETKALNDSLQNILTIVSINVDETSLWKPKATQKALPWPNTNDPKGRSGLALRYDVKAYPHYVLISPNGAILGAWSGYDKGELTKTLHRYLEGH